MTDGPSPRVTPDELKALVSGGRRAAAAERTSECREPADVALLLHAPEGDAGAAAFLTHAATCDDCGSLVEAAMHATGEDDDQEDRSLMRQLKTAAPEWQRQMAWRFAGAQQGGAPRRSRLWTAAALLVAAAAIVLAVRLTLPLWRGSSRPELQELVAAVGSEPTRPVEGRLTGGFAYAPAPTLQRGPGEQASPRVRIAEAKLEEAARASDTPEAQAALGVGLLAVGELDKAIDALEGAVQQKPGDARFQSDLAAAYLARAKWHDRAEDWPRALAAAERAIKADATLEEAHFNRALSLEGLHLDDQAAQAWSSYQALEKTPRWKDEATERAQKLKQRSSAAVPPDNQQVREHIEDELLAKWGEAVLAHRDEEAGRLLDEAERLSAALVVAGGDTMARDEVTLIRRARSRSDARLLTLFAQGHQMFGQARQEFRKDHVVQAADGMIEAARPLTLSGSPYALWGPVYHGIALRIESANAALKVLEPVTSRRLDGGFLALRARTNWAEAVAWAELERFDRELDRILPAAEAYRRAGELENLATARAIIAEARWILGDWEEAWAEERRAMALVNQMPQSIRRTYVLRLGATIALDRGLPEAALHFQNAAAAAIEGAGRSNGSTTYTQRAMVWLRLGDRAQASADLERAEHALANLGDPLLRDRGGADVRILRAELAATPQAAIDEANAAVQYAERSEPILRLPAALMLRARARERSGQLEDAERDLRRAIDTFEVRRAKVRSIRDRARAYDDEREAVRELVKFSAITRSNPDEALRVVERSRATASLEQQSAAPSVIDLAVVRAGLPSDTCVIYYVTLPDRVLGWVITRERVAYFSPTVTLQSLTWEVDRVRREIREGAGIDQLASSAKLLSDQILTPALALAGDKLRLVFVPDGPLFKVPFALMPDRRARPLLDTRIVGVASSLTGFLNASARLRGFVADDVLAVGDGHDTAASGLPRLALANTEAAEVRALYRDGVALVDSSATASRVLAEDRGVIHFAGHAVVNEQVPFLSRLLLARDDTRGDSGTLFVSDILSHVYPRLRVVVLATCDGAAGAVLNGEGVISLARAFFAAGAPSVVASLWPVDDQAHSLIMDFHRQLLADPDPARAMRVAQLAWRSAHGPASPVRLWGGFIAFGGAATSS